MSEKLACLLTISAENYELLVLQFLRLLVREEEDETLCPRM